MPYSLSLKQKAELGPIDSQPYYFDRFMPQHLSLFNPSGSNPLPAEVPSPRKEGALRARPCDIMPLLKIYYPPKIAASVNQKPMSHE